MTQYRSNRSSIILVIFKEIISLYRNRGEVLDLLSMSEQELEPILEGKAKLALDQFWKCRKN